MKNQWISIKDKLPDFNKTVLVNAESFDEDGYYPLLVAQLLKITIDAQGKHYDWNDFQNIGLVEVTHWMPLPEPPKE